MPAHPPFRVQHTACWSVNNVSNLEKNLCDLVLQARTEYKGKLSRNRGSTHTTLDPPGAGGGSVPSSASPSPSLLTPLTNPMQVPLIIHRVRQLYSARVFVSVLNKVARMGGRCGSHFSVFKA